MYDPRQFGERNPNSNDQPSRDERLLMNPIYADASPKPGQEDPPGNAHQITNSFHMYEGVEFENRENENVSVKNTPNAYYEVPIACAASNADTGEYSTLENNSCYSILGPSAITHPPGDKEEGYSHLRHSQVI